MSIPSTSLGTQRNGYFSLISLRSSCEMFGWMICLRSTGSRPPTKNCRRARRGVMLGLARPTRLVFDNEHARQEFAVALKDLTFTPEGSKQPRLYGINLSVRPGELVLITGPSGSGKSSLCDILTGVIPHMRPGILSGHCFVGGSTPADIPISALSTKVGRVFENPDNQFVMLSVADEVAFGLENFCMDPGAIRRRIP